MVCKVCGAENEARAEYCAACGAPLRPARNRRKGFTHPWILATVAAVLAGCAYGVGLALYLL